MAVRPGDSADREMEPPDTPVFANISCRKKQLAGVNLLKLIIEQ